MLMHDITVVIPDWAVCAFWFALYLVSIATVVIGAICLWAIKE